MIRCDCHVHSDISPDGKASMEEMCEAAIRRGLSEIVFTEHYECYYAGIRGRYFDREYLIRYFKRLDSGLGSGSCSCILCRGFELRQDQK